MTEKVFNLLTALVAVEWVTGIALAWREAYKSGLLAQQLAFKRPSGKPAPARQNREALLLTLGWVFACGVLAWIPLVPVFTAYKSVKTLNEGWARAVGIEWPVARTEGSGDEFTS